jgi:hypothetical protein
MKLRSSFRYVEDGGWWCGRFAGVFSLPIPRHAGDPDTGSGRGRERREEDLARYSRGVPIRALSRYTGSSGQLPGDARRRTGIAEALCADGHETSADVEEVTGVGGALDSPHADDGDRYAPCDRRHLRERNGAYGRPGQAPAATAEPRV